MAGTYASALAICAASLVLGRAIGRSCGVPGGSWLAAPVGFAALMVICQTALWLPGHGWTAVGVLVVVLALCLWRGGRDRWPSRIDLAAVGLGVLVITAVPFLASGRVGVLGISVLNDTHWHLLLAQGLLDPSIRYLDNYGVGYPLGPHAVAAVFAQGLGTSVDRSLTGVLIATPILTGLACLGLLPALSATRRWLVAVCAGIPYMAAAWYVQSAFKEPIMSLLLIGLVLALSLGRATGWRAPAAVAVPAAVLIAGVLYDYSYPGLVWPVAVLACWLVLELTVGGAWRRLAAVWQGLRTGAGGLAVAVLVLALPVAADAHRLYLFWQSNGGTAAGTVGGVSTVSLANLAGPLPSLEGLNVWLWGDFRFVPPGRLDAHVLPALALLALAFALARALARRELPWVGAVLGVALVYLYTKHSQSPYVAAKALAVPAPLLVVGTGSALLTPLSGRRVAIGLVLSAVGAAFAFGVLESDLLVLRDSQVGPSAHTAQLRGLRRLVHGRPTLVLFNDDYFKWELLGVPVSSPVLASWIGVSVTPAKPWSYGQPLDFNSISAAQLDLFDYVITTRTLAQSQPPSNFHLIGGSASYEVFQRVGLTPDLRVLPESGHPGAVLDCALPADRAISRERGTAAVRRAPIYAPIAPLQPGGQELVTLPLPAGRWQVSLPYTSPQAVRVQGSGLDVLLPANLDRPGSVWAVGSVTSTGAPVRLRVTMLDGGLMQSEYPSSQYFSPKSVVAVPPVPDTMIPLRDACGRYVDWYQLG